MKFQVTYQRNVFDTLEARDLDHAARMACQAVLSLPKEYGARVLSIVRIDPPAAGTTALLTQKPTSGQESLS